MQRALLLLGHAADIFVKWMRRLWFDVLLAPIPQWTRWGAYIQWSFTMACLLYFKMLAVGPGYSVAALALAAVIMTVRADKFLLTEKMIWILIGAVLVLGEFHILDADRTSQLRDRRLQDEKTEQRFQKTLDQFDTVSKQGREEFGETMKGVTRALNYANVARIQTSPHAVMRIVAIAPVGGYAQIAAGKKVSFTWTFTNDGQEAARNFRKAGLIYVADVDDEDAQKRLVKFFDEGWGKVHWATLANERIQPSEPGEDSMTHTFDNAEIAGLRSGSKAIYYLSRLSYTDDTGDWRSDDCFYHQLPPVEPAGAFACKVFINRRYRHASPK